MSVDMREARRLRRAALNSVKIEVDDPEPLLKESLFPSSSSMRPMLSDRKSSIQRSLESPSARRVRARFIPRLPRDTSDSDSDLGENEASFSSHLRRRTPPNSKRRRCPAPKRAISLQLVFSLFRLTCKDYTPLLQET